jgi:hypothetical protein
VPIEWIRALRVDYRAHIAAKTVGPNVVTVCNMSIPSAMTSAAADEARCQTCLAGVSRVT